MDQKRIIIIPTGGLANRMRAIASGYALSRETDRALDVIWHKDRGLNADFQDLFEYNERPFKICNNDGLGYCLYYDLPRKANLFLPSLFHLFDNRKWIYNVGPKAIKMKADFFLEEAKENKDMIIWSCSTFFDFPRSVVNDIFKPTERVRNRITEILSGKTPDISLQIRRTDNQISIAHSPLSLYEEAIERELATNPSTIAYLATDSQDVKLKFQKRYGERIVFNPEPARRDTLDGMIDAAAEMMIMAGTKRIYGSYWSSYSEMAAKIGNNDLIVVNNHNQV